MSDTVLSETGKRRAGQMTTAVAKSRRMLVALTTANHRGPNDTWTAARDRTAKKIGIERSYAARIWNRFAEMQDVSGEALMKISAAYVALCQRSEAAEALQALEAERITLETAHEIALAAALQRHLERMGETPSRQTAARASALPRAN